MPCVDFQNCFSVWSRLTPGQQNRMMEQLQERQVKKGTVLHNGSEDCTGLLLIKSGQLRVYILSKEGREITIYRLFDWDICLFSASCVMRSIQFDVTVKAEKDTEFWVIPAEVYRQLMEQSAAVANYTNEIISGIPVSTHKSILSSNGSLIFPKYLCISPVVQRQRLRSGKYPQRQGFIGTTKLIQFNDAPPKCTPLNLKNAGRKLIIPAHKKFFFLY